MKKQIKWLKYLLALRDARIKYLERKLTSIQIASKY